MIKVKGIIILQRKQMITDMFGEKKWNDFMKKLAEIDTYFNQTFLSITQIPVDKFLFFMDNLVKEFYNNDTSIYWKIGEKSAIWALDQGVYSFLAEKKDLEIFIKTSLPSIFRTYFSEGEYIFALKDKIVNVNITQVPKHIYFEYLLVGYTKQALELIGVKVIKTTKIKGFSNGDNEINYDIEIIRE